MSGFVQHNQGSSWQRPTPHKYLRPADIAAVSWLKVGIVSSRGLNSKIKRLLLSKSKSEKKPKFGHLRLSDTKDKFSVIQVNMLSHLQNMIF